MILIICYCKQIRCMIYYVIADSNTCNSLVAARSSLSKTLRKLSTQSLVMLSEFKTLCAELEIISKALFSKLLILKRRESSRKLIAVSSFSVSANTPQHHSLRSGTLKRSAAYSSGKVSSYFFDVFPV